MANSLYEKLMQQAQGGTEQKKPASPTKKPVDTSTMPLARKPSGSGAAGAAPIVQRGGSSETGVGENVYEKLMQQARGGRGTRTSTAPAEPRQPIDTSTVPLNRTPEEIALDRLIKSQEAAKGINPAAGTSPILNGIYDRAEERVSTLRSSPYGQYLKKADYAEKSRAGGSKIRFIGGDSLYDYINDINGYRAKEDSANAGRMGMSPYAKYAFMSEDEIGVYNYLYATEGKKAAKKYLKALEPELDKQMYSGQSAVMEEAAVEHPWAMSGLTVASQPIRTTASMIATGQDIYRAVTGQGINPYSRLRQPGRMTSDVRGAIAEDLENNPNWFTDAVTDYGRWQGQELANEWAVRNRGAEGNPFAGAADSMTPEAGGKAASFVYQTAMSAADSAVNMALARGLAGDVTSMAGVDLSTKAGTEALMKATNIIGSLTMSSEVMSLGVAEAKEKINPATGQQYSDMGALAVGFIRGAVEYASEAIGGEWAIRNIKANPLNFVKSMVLNMIPEGVEEVMSDVMNGTVNLVIDQIFDTEESGIPALMQEFSKEGWQQNHPWIAQILGDDASPMAATVLYLLGEEGLSFLGGALATVGTSGVQTYNIRQGINAVGERMGSTPQDIAQLMEEYEADPWQIGELGQFYEAENAEDFRAKAGTGKKAADILEETREQRTEKRKTDLSADGIRRIFSGIGTDITDSEARVLADGMTTGDTDESTYLSGVLDAFRMGQMGNVGLQEAMRATDAGAKLTASQFRHAWQLGRMRSGAETVDIKTEEGQTRLEASFASLGDGARAAVDAYEEGQDVDAYAAAMTKAARLYAANGQDLHEVAEQARSGERADIVSQLTDAQLDVAMEIGQQLSEQRTAAEQRASDRLRTLRSRADAIREGGMNAPTIAQVDKTISEAEKAGKEAQNLFREELAALQQMEDQNSPEFEALYRQAEAHKDTMMEMKQAIDDLETQKKNLQENNRPAEERKGRLTVAAEDGEVEGVSYKAVDESKLTGQQKAVVGAVGTIADLLGLDVTVIDAGSKTGGIYSGGGKIYLNIAAGVNIKSIGKAIAAGSFAHELTHWLAEYAPEQYAALRKIVTRGMSAEQLDSLVQDQLRMKPDMSYDEAVNEVVANAAMPLLETSKAFERIARENMTLAEKILDFLKQFADRIKAAFEGIDWKADHQVFRAVQAVEDRLSEMQEAFDKAVVAARENMAAEAVTSENKNTASEGGVKYQRVTSESDSIRVQIQNAEDQLNAMDVVARVSAENVPKGVDKATKWAVERMSHTGFRAERKGFGTIIFDENHIREALRHITNRPDEMGAVLALPRVLKRGIIIEQHDQHKGRVQASYTIAAPVEINGVRGNMAVVVHRTTRNFYHAHRVLLPDGANFTFDENYKADPKRTGELPGDRALIAESVGSASKDRITDTGEEVKGSSGSSGKSYYQLLDVEPVQPATTGWKRTKTTAEAMEAYPNLWNVAAEESDTRNPTQIASTQGTYRKIYNILRNDGFTGRILDASSGMGIGTQIGREEYGFEVDDIEPYPDKSYKPKYTDYSKLNEKYDAIISSAVLNVLPQDQRDALVVKMGELLNPGGKMYITTRGRDVDNLSKTGKNIHLGPMEWIETVKGSYQKGFTQPELIAYLTDALGEGFSVEGSNRTNGGKFNNNTSIVVTKNGDATDAALQHAAPKFQMLGEVEATDRLVALHNKSVSGLRRMLQRGGVPFPSIAIKKAGAPHIGFGDVTIVFPRASIDPQMNRDNRIYSNDAWTPTEPTVEYDVGDTYRYIKKIQKLIGDDLFFGLHGSSYLEENELAKRLQYNRGDIIEAIKNISVLKYAYLKSIGKEPRVPGRAQNLDGFRKYKNEQLLAIFDALMEGEIENLSYGSEAAQKAADALNEQYRSKYEEGSRAWIALGKKPAYSADNINPTAIQDAYHKYKDNGFSILAEPDFDTFDRAMRDDTELENSAGYHEWLQENFGDLVVDSGIRNDRDIFTPSGNRRTFQQLHRPATLDNIVAMMRQQNETGNGIVGINLRGAATKSYQTVEEARAESGRLLGTHIADDVYDGIMKGFYERLNALAASATISGEDDWEAVDAVKEILLEAVRDCNTRQAMIKRLNRESRWLADIDLNELGRDLWQLKQDVQNMPAPYFEAKPRRVVSPMEALAYVVPDNADSDVMKALEAGGYNVLTYKAGDEQDRAAKVNSVQGALFQRLDDTSDDTETERQGRESAYARLQSENAILAETVAALNKLTAKQSGTIEKLMRDLHLSKTPEVRESDARKMARSLLKEFGSTADAEKVAADLKALGDYILQTKATDISEQEVKDRARHIAAGILNEARGVVDWGGELDHVRDIASQIKGKKLSIDEHYLGELDVLGGYDAFRKSVFGTFVLAKRETGERETREGYTTVDHLYSDLQSQYGERFFPDVSNEGEMVSVLADVARAANPEEVNPFDHYMGEATEDLANRIAMDALGGVLRQDTTAMDRQKARRDALREQIKELKAQKAVSDKEAYSLYETIYDLSLALDKAESKYRSLQVGADNRMAQMRAEGLERAAEIRARERARASEKITALKEHYQDMASRQRERREESTGVTKYRKQVDKKAKALYELLVTNSNDKHVPEVLKQPLGEFLESISFASKRSLAGGADTKNDEKMAARLLRIQQMLANQQSYINGDGSVQEDLGGYIDVSNDVLEELRQMAETITQALSMGRGFTVNQMTASQLKTLSKFLSNLTTAIKNMNRMMANARYESVKEAASADVEYMKSLGRVSERGQGGVSKFTMWKNGIPYYVFRRYGEGGRSIFDSFTKGWEKMAMNAQEIIAFTDKTYTDKEVRAWKKEMHDFTLDSGDKIRMTTGQIMELAMLLGREQAMKHITKGGIRIGDIETGKGKISDTKHYHLTSDDIQKITDALTDRQMEVAKALQSYMARRGGEWGNEISMRRFGYNFYEEGEGYYPIRTDSNDRPMADTDAQTNSMFRLLNLSSSKALNPKASNALVVDDIFATFSDHMADMAKLNGMGLSILDAIKWFNFKERVNHDDGTYDTRTIQGAMEQAYGGQAQKYFRTLMKDINGQSETGDRGMSIGTKFMGNYKAAAVGANLRVALLQPTSYVRAQTVLKPKYLLAAFTRKNGYQEAMKYSGTAVWKSLGFFDTDIAKSMRGQIQHDDTLREKVVEKSMALAELGDKLTWGRLWNACKMQTKAENSSLAGEALMQATADLFRQVIYSSQVMDATLTRSEIMRARGNFTKMASAFMAEPTLSYNILMDAASEWNIDRRRYNSAEAWKRNSGKIGKALVTYLSSAAFAALVESMADAARDDDDDDYWDKVQEAFLGDGGKLTYSGNLAQDLTIVGKLPYFKDLVSIIQGYQSQNLASGAFINLWDVYKIWVETYKLSTGELEKATKVTSYGKMTEWGKIYKTLQAMSQLTGLPGANMMRDVFALWNTVVNGRKDEWKIKRYDDSNAEMGERLVKAYESGDSAEIDRRAGAFESEKKALDAVKDQLKGEVQEGERTPESAAEVLKKAGLGEDDIFFLLQKWETGDNGKYTALKRALIGGDKAAFRDAMKDLTEHGIKEREANNQLKTFLRKAYLGAELSEEETEILGDTTITDAEARRLLHDYAGMDTDDAVNLVREWQFQKKSGFSYDDRRELYLEGSLTRTELRKALMSQGGKTSEEAEAIIKDYDFEKKYGWAWSERKERYQKGKVPKAEMLRLLQSHGGKTAEEARNQLLVWDWQKDVRGADNITATAIGKYNSFCASAGVSKETYVRAWAQYNDTKGEVDKKGKSIPYSKTKKYMAYLNTLPISAQQKTAIALCFWSKSVVKKYKRW